MTTVFPRRPTRAGLSLLAAAVFGAAALAVAHSHAHTPRPRLAETTFAPPAVATDLPFRVTSPSSCPAFSFRSPVETLGYGPGFVFLVGPPGPLVSLRVLCDPDGQHGGLSLDEQVDHLRRNAAQAHLAADPVIEHGPLGDALRVELRPGVGHATEWRVERDGRVVIVRYTRPAADDSHDAQVEAMLASWTWG